MAGQMVSVPFGHTRVSRIEPALPASAFKTYGWSMPLRTHWRPASCEEYGCADYQHGWVTTVDLSTDLGQRQYEYCSHDRTRSFHMQRVSETLAKFVYKPGSRCFAWEDHHVPLGRPGLFTVTGGDWRGNPRGVPQRRHARAEDWIDDFANHQDTIATAIRKG